MGHYIQGPLTGKAEYIVSEYDARHPPPGPISFDKRPDDYEWVCVVDSGAFEAAVWLYDRREFDVFAHPEPVDSRSRKFLLVPTAKIKQIFAEHYHRMRPVKPTDIPNGFVVRSPDGKPLLVDFDDRGEPEVETCTEIASDGWLAEGGIPKNYVALVHTVKSNTTMLVKLLLMTIITDKSGRPVSAQELGERDALMPFVKGLRDEYVKKISGLTSTPTDTGA